MAIPTGWIMTIAEKSFIKAFAKRNNLKYKETDSLNYKISIGGGREIERVEYSIPNGSRAFWKYAGREYKNLEFLMNEWANDKKGVEV